MRPALCRGDLAHAVSASFQGRVKTALEIIDKAARIGRIGVYFSGGKDSTVLLDLVRRVQPECAAVWFDSGAEYKATYEMARVYHVRVIQPLLSLPEMCRRAGVWGANATEPGAQFDYGMFLLQEPAYRAVLEEGLAVEALGLRAEENTHRRASLGRKDRGELYPLSWGTWRLCPLAFWNTNDVWAYIASEGLEYNAAYDKMAAAGIPRESWRVSTLLGSEGLRASSRYAVLRRVEPATYERLAAEFPHIRRFAE